MTSVAVIGAGRVGLPLALSLLESGHDVHGVDINPAVRRAINDKKIMPFHEPGYDGLVAAGRLKIVEDVAALKGAVDNYIVTVGTPVMQHLEADLTAIIGVIDSLLKTFKRQDLLILRSTLAPGVTVRLRNYIEQKTGWQCGQDFYLAFCPERLVEGKAYEEIRSLPQIIGADDGESLRRAEAVFAPLGMEILSGNVGAAELAKLFANTGRYLEFAIANQLATIAMEHDQNPFEVFRLANYGYARPIADRPGLTAGTCLRKDFGLLMEGRREANFLLSAWRVHERLPQQLIDEAERAFGAVAGRTVGILGATFKRDTDDLRDSLVPKLVRALDRCSPAGILVTDPFVDDFVVSGVPVLSFETDLAEVLDAADLLIIATNHSLYEEEREVILRRASERGIGIIDPWGLLRHEAVIRP